MYETERFLHRWVAALSKSLKVVKAQAIPTPLLLSRREHRRIVHGCIVEHGPYVYTSKREHVRRTRIGSWRHTWSRAEFSHITNLDHPQLHGGAQLLSRLWAGRSVGVGLWVS